MSNVSIKTGGKKAFIYVAIISSVIIINIISNRKYILNSISTINSPKIELVDSSVNPVIKPSAYRKQLRVLSGQSIDSLLLKEGVPESYIVSSSRALKEVFDPRDLKAGSRVNISFKDPNVKATFLGYELEIDYKKSIIITKSDNGVFKGSTQEKDFSTLVNVGKGVIDSSLYQSAVDSGITPNTIMNLIQLYSFDVDFQRDIKSGTEFEIIYETYVDEDGKVVEHGNILAAVLKFTNRRVPIYRYTAVDGKTDYFNEKGRSARKALLKTPVNGAFISSTFGMRRHPISGYSAFHRGTDFAVKKGTPIYASGDGVISSAVISNKGYGIHIKIRHPNGYETLYAHMSAHAKGVYRGLRVSQGQVIGYVGSTGMSTGPHLHYETRYNGKFVNPSSIKIPPGRVLKGEELENFIQVISKNPLSI